MEIKDAIRILAEEIADSRYPIKTGSRQEFERVVSDCKKNYYRYNTFTKEVDVDGNKLV